MNENGNDGPRGFKRMDGDELEPVPYDRPTLNAILSGVEVRLAIAPTGHAVMVVKEPRFTTSGHLKAIAEWLDKLQTQIRDGEGPAEQFTQFTPNDFG